jgi:hypothetical protein
LTFKGTSMGKGVVKAQSLDGPGITGSNIELRPQQDGDLPPGYYWPAAAAESMAAPQKSGLSGGQVAGVVVGCVSGVALLLFAVLAGKRRRRRHAQHEMLLPGKSSLDAAGGLGNGYDSGRSEPRGSNPGSSQISSIKSVAGTGSVTVDVASARDNLSPLPGAALQSGRSSGSADGRLPAAAACMAAAGAAAAAASSSGSGTPGLAGSLASAGVSSSAGPSSSDSISLGLDRWKAAISTTTMQLMQRRMLMGSSSLSTSSASVRTPSGGSRRPGSSSSRGQAGSTTAGQQQQQQQSSSLQVHELIGQGSFGSVWLGESGLDLCVSLLLCCAWVGICAAPAFAHLAMAAVNAPVCKVS